MKEMQETYEKNEHRIWKPFSTTHFMIWATDEEGYNISNQSKYAYKNF